MKTAFIAAASIGAVAASNTPSVHTRTEGAVPVQELSFSGFTESFAKAYSSKTEASYRAAVYSSNVQKVASHNTSGATYQMAINKFADLTPAEFSQKMTGLNMAAKTAAPSVSDVSSSPVADGDSVDWRNQNAVTPIKNQGQCGSCWSFSTTGSIEGAHAISTGTLVSLSEQNLIDCSTSYGNQGCDGGLMDSAFKYVIANGGIDTESSYPYSATGPNSCNYSASNSAATISSYTDVTSGDENQLQQAIKSKGPISVAVDASSWQFYSSGVYNDASCSTSNLDHGVLAVGYGADSGTNMYIVKNSWGTDWGLSGYIYLARDGSNQCGIATMASYPVV